MLTSNVRAASNGRGVLQGDCGAGIWTKTHLENSSATLGRTSLLDRLLYRASEQIKARSARCS